MPVGSLASKIGAKDARIVIAGVGCVGLPLSVAFAEAGNALVGLRPNERRPNDRTLVARAAVPGPGSASKGRQAP